MDYFDRTVFVQQRDSFIHDADERPSTVYMTFNL